MMAEMETQVRRPVRRKPVLLCDKGGWQLYRRDYGGESVWEVVGPGRRPLRFTDPMQAVDYHERAVSHA